MELSWDWSEPGTFSPGSSADRVMARWPSCWASSRASRLILLLAPGHLDGIYVLAGGAHPDGSLPYWWMSRTRLAALRALGDRPPADRIATTS